MHYKKGMGQLLASWPQSGLVRLRRMFHLPSFNLFAIATICLLASCQSRQPADLYSMDDFAKVKKIDVHAHSLTSHTDFVQQAKDDNFILISMNVEVPDYPPLDSQQNYVLRVKHQYPDNIYLVTTFETATMNQPGWSNRQIAHLEKAFDSGAVGVKVWKNIGMVIRNKDSNFIQVDDPVFDPIFNYLEQHDLPVIGHIGEPKNCWLPLDQMTTRNDSDYYSRHPQYHMFLHPEYPSYDTIIAARDHLLAKHPRLRFNGAHLGSLEWSVDELAKRLDKFPNMSVETAARIGQVQYQGNHDWQKTHDFLIKYQDRIMYGTDLEATQSDKGEEVKKNAHETWLRDWKYFTSGDSVASPFVNGKTKGLQLPREVIDKLYYRNAEKFYLRKK